jgi:hypothetical protein
MMSTVADTKLAAQIEEISVEQKRHNLGNASALAEKVRSLDEPVDTRGMLNLSHRHPRLYNWV